MLLFSTPLRASQNRYATAKPPNPKPTPELKKKKNSTAQQAKFPLGFASMLCPLLHDRMVKQTVTRASRSSTRWLAKRRCLFPPLDQLLSLEWEINITKANCSAPQDLSLRLSTTLSSVMTVFSLPPPRIAYVASPWLFHPVSNNNSPSWLGTLIGAARDQAPDQFD